MKMPRAEAGQNYLHCDRTRRHQHRVLKKAADAWNRWRSENANVVLNLDEADLQKANLYKANLSGANLSGAGKGWWSWAWRQWRGRGR
jgi:Pentapeptide repeats (8 copies)